MATNILIVEDNPNLLTTLKCNLAKEDFRITTATDGTQALEIARSKKPGLIVLDVMLPELSGSEVYRILRKEMIVAILMLITKVEEVDKIVGLEIGAVDYMIKPFSMGELLARIRTMLHRADVSTARPVSSLEILKIGDLEIDFDHHQVLNKSKLLNLTPKEYGLLVFLVNNRGLVFSREQLLDKVWGYDYAGDTRTVDVHVRWLRKKIETDPAYPEKLLTIRGVGYKLVG